MNFNFRSQATVALLVVLLIVGLFGASAARADELYGRVRGLVTDPAGAVLPGVQLKLINVGTGISTEVVSGSDGSFSFLSLQPGTYQLTASKTTFKGFEVRGITVVQGQIYVQNVRMELGTVTEVLQVEANPAQVETNSTQLGSVISGNTIVDMPLVGRNWIQLQQTLPGVVGSSDRFTNNYATNGSQTQQNSYLVNGVDTNDLPLNTPLVIPSPDAIGEVTLVTNTINPEYGRNSGAILNAVIKSGTNSLHGSGFEFYRDTFLNTKAWFQNTASQFHQNLFGGTIGGPVWKNKTFFFFSYQGTRSARPQSISSTQVFTPAERGGDFSASGTFSSNSIPFPMFGDSLSTCPVSAGVQCQPSDPNSTYAKLFSTGVIPAEDLSALALNLTKTYVPLPNSGTREFDFNPVQTNKTDQEIAKIDHTFSSHDAIWGYGLWQRSPQTRTLPFTGADLPGFGDQSRSNTQQYVIAWNHTFNTDTLNETRVGYTRLNFQAVFPQKAVLPSSVGFTGVTPQNTAAAGVPTIAVTGLFTLGFSDNGPQPRIDQTYQFTDNFTKVIGRHTLKTGFEMRRFHVSNPFFFLNNGHFDFAGSGTYTTGLPGADFLLGIPDDYFQGSGGFIDATAQQYYSYFQDQFKLRSNLTLNYGVGWQVDTPLSQNFNQGVSIHCWHFGQQSTVFPTAPLGLTFPGDQGCNSAGYSTKWGHFGPRLGVAYSPGSGGKTSIRAGVGLYFNRSEEELTLQTLATPPFGLQSAGIGDAPNFGVPGFSNPFVDVTGAVSATNKFPFTPPQPGAAVDFSFFEPMSISVMDPNFNTPRALNYNLTLQRELPTRMIFTLGYVGAQGRHLIGVQEMNPGINPAGCAGNASCRASRNIQNLTFPQNFAIDGRVMGSIGQQGTFNTSNYNSLQASVKKSLSHGLEFLAAYTWSHSLDTGSSFENSGFGGSRRGQNPFNHMADYGDSEFDARHRFVLSYSYSFPQFKDVNRAVRYLIGGWRLAGITTLQGGFPVFVRDSGFRTLTCTAFSFYACPDNPNYLGGFHMRDPKNTSLINKVRSPSNTQSLNNYYFDPNIFARQAFGLFGNARRAEFAGPGFNNTDLALYKDFPLHSEGPMKIELRLESFNIANHAHFANPNGNVNSANFGRVTSLLTGDPGSPRVTQLAAKFYF